MHNFMFSEMLKNICLRSNNKIIFYFLETYLSSKTNILKQNVLYPFLKSFKAHNIEKHRVPSFPSFI